VKACCDDGSDPRRGRGARRLRQVVAVVIVVGVAILIALNAGCRGAAAHTPAVTCSTTPVRVTTQAELDALGGCAQLAGLELRGAMPFDLTPLTGLTTIRGDLVVRSTFALGAVRLPALARVDGAVMLVGNLDLGGVYLPALRRARAITIADSPVLIEVMMPALAAVAHTVAFERLASLELVDLSALPAVDGGLRVSGVGRLASWYGPTEAAAMAQAHGQSEP